MLRRRAEPCKTGLPCVFFIGGVVNNTVRLLIAAGVLMLLAGVIFGLLKQWIFAALVWTGAVGCLVAALNLKN